MWLFNFNHCSLVQFSSVPYIATYIYIYHHPNISFCLFSQTFPFLSICFFGGRDWHPIHLPLCRLRFTWLPNNARCSQRSWCRSNLPRTALGKMGQCRVCCFFDVSGCEFLPNRTIKTNSPFKENMMWVFFSEVWMQMIAALWDYNLLLLNRNSFE